MVRLVLVLSPAVCVAGAIATSETLRTYMNILTKEDAEDSAAAAAAPAAIEEGVYVCVCVCMIYAYVCVCVFV